MKNSCSFNFADTELIRFGARDYDSRIGRWTTKDPAGLAGGLNQYAYVSGNPMTYTDPSGLFASHIHMWITSIATGQFFGSFGLDPLSLSVAAADIGTQSAEDSYKHAMSDSLHGQSPLAAKIAFENFVTSEIRKCSREGLANALHAVQDTYAEGHSDFQGWAGGKPSVSHMFHDFFPSFGEFFGAVGGSMDTINRYNNACRR